MGQRNVDERPNWTGVAYTCFMKGCKSVRVQGYESEDRVRILLCAHAYAHVLHMDYYYYFIQWFIALKPLKTSTCNEKEQKQKIESTLGQICVQSLQFRVVHCSERVHEDEAVTQ